MFATDSPDETHLEFTLLYECVHPDSRSGSLVLRGEGRYMPATQELADVRLRGEEFVYPDEDGTAKTDRVVVGAISMTIGHRTVRNAVRARLD
jgi:hypothetical protein